jgi:hypothetical protein
MADSVLCPYCGKKVPLTKALKGEIEESLRKDFDATLRRREKELSEQFASDLEESARRIQKEARSNAEKHLAAELKDLKEQVKEQDKELAEAKRQELILRRKERELDKKRADLELTVEKTIQAERDRIASEVATRIGEERRLKDAEKDRQLEELRGQIEQLKRKAEQGSQQSQGEAAEQEMEETLRELFPLDDIRAISQGVRGADLCQCVVENGTGRCGSILWEFKNTKNWSDSWLPKLRDDQRAAHADIAVIVSSVLPKNVSGFSLIDGVWVSDYKCATGLACALRINLVQLTRARRAAVGKTEKLEILYRYLSGVEFRQRVEAIVESFAAMQRDLDQEKRAAEKSWAKRAKQIERVTHNIAGMYGDMQGIVGAALPPIAVLELPGATAEEDNAE